METEITAQDDSTGIDKSAISNLAAALEAKDEDTEAKESTDEKTGEEGAKKEESDTKGLEASEEDTKGKESTDAKEGKEAGQEESKEAVPDGPDEVAELRGLLRSQKRELSLLKAKHSRVDKRTSKVIDEVTGEEKDIEEDLSPLETKIEERDSLSDQREGPLEVLLEQMSDTKKWGDVKEVVTEGRVDELVDSIASQITKEKGGDAEVNKLDVEISIWSISNPYKYLYELIKQYHPDYATTEKKEEKEDETGKKETKTDSTEKKKKKPVKTNASIGGMTGGTDKSGWTAAKIDAMDELDLGKVPKDVYDMYLRGELE